MFPKSITKEEINQLPIGHYEGEIVMVETADALAEASKELMEFPYLGFDTETRPAFRKGDYYPISLIQIASPEKVYLVRNQLSGFHPLLNRLFSSDRTLKIGVGLHDELKELNKMYAFRPQGFVDLNKLMGEIGVQNIGVRNMAAIFLNFRISKGQQTTNWEREELTDKQKIYAATDAWVCLEIYQKLKNWALID
ncbi:3'-5' exonuclease [Cytophagales bacterium LB-30]|uniref:3'-5' exonuclease n=1 Tax=Shiella aurantiaca TaxID=3058365 RepID=A0ABT8F901_9BACT|nr:3'-5' exonuclease [Shiella aurantiaca]MDN4166920.1 3'-5' exonuclease [Shiella aurantiaca]